MTSPFIPASGQPVALTVQLRVNDYSSNGSLPTPSIWQQWFNRWWEALSVDELPYLAPFFAFVKQIFIITKHTGSKYKS